MPHGGRSSNRGQYPGDTRSTIYFSKGNIDALLSFIAIVNPLEIAIFIEHECNVDKIIIGDRESILLTIPNNNIILLE